MAKNVSFSINTVVFNTLNVVTIIFINYALLTLGAPSYLTLGFTLVAGLCLISFSCGTQSIFNIGSLCFAYILLSLTVGAVSFEFNLLSFNDSFVVFYEQWLMSEKFTFEAFIVSSISLFFIYPSLFDRVNKNNVKILNVTGSTNSLYIASCILFFIVSCFFSYFGFRPQFLGSSGNHANFFYFYYLSLFIVLFRPMGLFYFPKVFAICAILSLWSYGDRRDVIYFLIICIAFYFQMSPVRLFKLGIVGFSSIFLATLLVVLMSSLRSSYLNTNIPVNIDYLVANIDVVYFYFHGLNSIHLALNDPELYSYGETVVKWITTPLPRAIFDWKPSSMLTLYTSAYDPVYRAAGNSYPVNFLSELFWNFGFLAPVAALFFGFLLVYFNRIYRNALVLDHKYLFSILFCAQFLIFNVMRGSGIEYFVYGLFFIFCASLISYCFFFLKRGYIE